MPIVTLEERISTWKAMPLLAVLRKGSEKRTNKKGQSIFGEDLPYFRLEFGEDYQLLAGSFAEMFGLEPDEIGPVMLLPDSWEAWMMEFKASKLIRKCDGHTQALRLQDGGYVHEAAPCPRRSGHACECKPSGMLRFLIPRFSEATGYLGYFLLKTHSVNDIVQIESAIRLAAVGRALHTCQFVLKRREEEVATRDAEGRSIRVKKWLVKLEQLDALAFSNAPQQHPQLPAPQPRLGPSVDEVPWDDEADDSPPPARGKAGRTAGARNIWSETLNVNFVKEQTAFLYPHPAHQNRSIKKLIDTNVLRSTDSNTLAVCKVFAHRAEVDHGVSQNMLGAALSAALPEDQPVAGLGDWLRQGYTLQAGWEAICRWAEQQRQALNAAREPQPAQTALDEYFEPGDFPNWEDTPLEDVKF